MLGVGILITVLSVMNGFEKELRDKILSFTSHVNIYPSDSVSTKDIEDIIDIDKDIDIIDKEIHIPLNNNIDVDTGIDIHIDLNIE